jgi:hypothetical protein
MGDERLVSGGSDMSVAVWDLVQIRHALAHKEYPHSRSTVSSEVTNKASGNESSLSLPVILTEPRSFLMGSSSYVLAVSAQVNSFKQ